MNILLLIDATKGDAKNLSRRIHYDFICRLKEHCVFHIYGPGEDDPDLSPLKYKKEMRFDRVLRYYAPDIVLCYSIFCVYKWLPVGFRSSSVVKVCMEVDYWNIARRYRTWYKDNRFTFLVQRGHYKKSSINSVWLPFSASEDLLLASEVSLNNRKREIAFVGRGGICRKRSLYYPIRRKAIEKLEYAKLINNIGVVGHGDYPSILSRSLCYFCDSGRFDSPPAKTFEIMAAGGLLLTTPFSGYKRLFDRRRCCVFYDKDLVDVVPIAKEVLSMSIGEVEEIVEEAKEQIYSKHMHEHRIQDLMEIFYFYSKQGTLTKRWGI